MFNGDFEIKFECRVAKTGYKWKETIFKGRKVTVKLEPKREEEGFKTKEYSEQAYIQFKNIINKYNNNKTQKELREWGDQLKDFADNWGPLEGLEQTFSAKYIYNKAETQYLSLLGHIKDELVPQNPLEYIPQMDITYGWDRHGNKMLPIYKPYSLWNCILCQIIFSGIDEKDLKRKICKRKDCRNSFSGKYVNKNYCSNKCYQKDWEADNRPSKNQPLEKKGD